MAKDIWEGHVKPYDPKDDPNSGCGVPGGPPPVDDRPVGYGTITRKIIQPANPPFVRYSGAIGGSHSRELIGRRSETCPKDGEACGYEKCRACSEYDPKVRIEKCKIRREKSAIFSKR